MYSEQVKIQGVTLDVEFTPDADTITIDRIMLPDSCGEDIACLLDKDVLRDIRMRIVLDAERKQADNRRLNRWELSL